MLQPKRVVRPPGLPRLVGAPVEPETAPKPVQASPAMVVPPEVRLTINRFLLFLRNRQLNMTKLLELPIEEQTKLRMEFFRIQDTPEVYRLPAQLDKIHIVTADEKKHFAYVKTAEAAIAFLESNNFFLHEINTALRYTRSRIKSNEIIGGVAVNKFPDTLEDVGTARKPSDLEQNIYLELIESTIKYGKTMSGALAYKIAKNLTAEFVGKKIKESKKKVELDNVQGDNDGNEEEINGFEQQMTVSNNTVGKHETPTMDGVGPGIPTSS